MELAGGRVGALDGLRGIALIAVLVYHAAPDVLGGGFLGVEMFFVLSGFLLITLLLDEEQRRGLIDPWAYATRRLRRIAPALIVMLTVLAIAAPFLARDDAHRLPRDILASVAGLTNWHLIDEGASYFAQAGRPSLVRHLWSIAVEVQAYIAIPFIAAILVRHSRRRSATLLLAGIATSATVMAVLYASPDPSRAYFGTDARIGALFAGALVAVLVRGRTDTEARLGRMTARASMLLFAAGAGSLCVLFIAADERARLLYPAGFLATELCTAAVIVAALRPGRPQELLSNGSLRWLGRRSYGIYLWHWPLVALARPGIDVSWPRPAVAATGIGAAIVLGALSYRYVERPFLLARTWARRPLPSITRVGAIGWVAAMLAVVALVARTSAVDPIAESLLAGERALAEQEAPVVEHGGQSPGAVASKAGTKRAVGPAGVARPVAAPGKVPSVKGPKPGSITLSAVGDSVMLGAATRMKARFGSKSYINAEKNRRYSQAAKVVSAWRKSGRLGRVLVVHLGNNGPAKPAELDAVFKEAKPAEHILLITVRVTKPWQDSVNATLKAAAKKHDKVWLVDWHATSRGHPDWFYSDGTHMNGAGADAYTKLVAAKIPPAKKAAPKPKPDPTSKPKPTPTPGLVDGVELPD